MMGEAGGPLESVAISGASGFLGSALSEALRSRGTRVLRLVRRPAQGRDEISWSPSGGSIEGEKLEGVSGVVHLAGENIAGIWTSAKKERIKQSRVQGTRLIASTLARLQKPPRVLVSTSGVNYYGDRGEAVLDESEPPGDDFLARVCVEWESATAAAAEAGIRVVINRMGVVLHPDGGVLRIMLPIFKLGLGGKLGSGRQWISWVSIRDAVRAIEWELRSASLRGPVNLASPNPVLNDELTRAIAKAVRRPALFVVPSFALRGATGGMADALLLSSVRAQPAKLEASDFHFNCPTIEQAVREGLDGNG